MNRRIQPLDRNGAAEREAADAERELNKFYGLSPKERSVRVERWNINVRICEYGGDAQPPVLVVPGNTGDSFPLVPLFAQLPGRRILALNRPGGGLSDGFDHAQADFRELAIGTINAALDCFGIAAASIIAHSMGGHWSLWYAAAHPERVNRLALLGVPGNVLGCRPPLALRLASIPGLNSRLFDAMAAKSAEAPLKSLSFLGHSDESVARLPSELARCHCCFQRLPNYKTSSLSLMEKANTVFGSKRSARIGIDDLRKVAQPVLIAWGGNDPFGSIAQGKKIAAALSEAALRVIPNGGHLPWLDDPVRCGEMVSEFLNG
jgi:pimeloyl-ACP methyl ester carboxylesterase